MGVKAFFEKNPRTFVVDAKWAESPRTPRITVREYNDYETDDVVATTGDPCTRGEIHRPTPVQFCSGCCWLWRLT